MCLSGKKHKPRKSKPGGKVHEFQAGDFPEDPQLPTASNFMIGSITQVNATEVRELHRSVRVHGNDIRLKVDSGADGNVIPNSVFENVRLQEEIDTGRATEISSYFGTKLTTLETTVLSCTYKDTEYPLVFHVMNYSVNPVIGLSDSMKLGMISGRN